ncbi:hypothetical protein [Kaistia sp. UC242_56]|uniref:hypothetical protein n=1 Tax=Kaistia sp. UC242_56 TaxID=3374625 RepID=UPI0037AC8152
MKRVNLLEYFELAEALQFARQASTPESSEGGALYVGLWQLPIKLRSFVADNNGFVTSKNAASSLIDSVTRIVSTIVPAGDFKPENFSKEYQSWEYSEIPRKIDAFKSVFEAECRDVDVYSVDEISIYKTSALVSNGSGIIPIEYRSLVSKDVLDEFDNSGKCLAFNLPTACGFHALRGLELVMESYLRYFGVTKKLHSWNDYIQAAKKLVEDKDEKRKPSAKVATMLDRMRELDRNPLMHPTNTLDITSADILYKLAAITIVEIVRDMGETPL